MISSRVGLTTMWIYPIIESIACYFMILDFVPSPAQTTLISHKNTILWPQVENFMPFFQTTVETFQKHWRIFSTIEEIADYLLFIAADQMRQKLNWKYFIIRQAVLVVSSYRVTLGHHTTTWTKQSFPPKSENPSFLPPSIWWRRWWWRW